MYNGRMKSFVTGHKDLHHVPQSVSANSTHPDFQPNRVDNFLSTISENDVGGILSTLKLHSDVRSWFINIRKYKWQPRVGGESLKANHQSCSNMDQVKSNCSVYVKDTNDIKANRCRRCVSLSIPARHNMYVTVSEKFNHVVHHIKVEEQMNEWPITSLTLESALLLSCFPSLKRNDQLLSKSSALELSLFDKATSLNIFDPCAQTIARNAKNVVSSAESLCNIETIDLEADISKSTDDVPDSACVKGESLDKYSFQHLDVGQVLSYVMNNEDSPKDAMSFTLKMEDYDVISSGTGTMTPGRGSTDSYCSMCDMYISNSGHHNEHTHTSNKELSPFYRCSLCPFRCDSLPSIELHATAQHSNEHSNLRNKYVYLNRI